MIKSQTKTWLKHVHEIADSYPFLDEPGPSMVVRNEEGRLHNEVGPAFRSYTTVQHWQDGRKHGVQVTRYGSKCYFFKGVLVPQHYVEDPKNLTLDEVVEHRNTEVRRVGCEIYGFDRMITEGKFKEIDHDQKTRARLLQSSVIGDNDEALTIVKVFDGTDPDKSYILQVPPRMTKVHDAIAWTFHKEPQEYKPQSET